MPRLTAGIKPATQSIWEAIRDRGSKPFICEDIQCVADASRRTVQDYLARLVAAGILERIEGGARLQWRLLRDPGPDAPRLRADGSEVVTGGGIANMWRSMRMMPQFTPRDLAAHSTTAHVTVTEGTAKQYCQHLHAAGYLRVVRKAVPLKNQAVYRLIRNTGPRAPQLQRVKSIYDPNDGSLHLPRGAK